MGSRMQLRACTDNGIPFPEFNLRGECARKPTARSQNWKKLQQLKRNSKGNNSDEPFSEVESYTVDNVHRLDPDDSLETRTSHIVYKKSSGKPTTRSQNWKKMQQAKQAAEGRNPDKPFCEWRSHTTDCAHRLDPEEPCYNLGPHTAGIPVFEEESFKKPMAISQYWKKQQLIKQASKEINFDKPFSKLQSHTPEILISKKTVGISSAGAHSHNSEQRNQGTIQECQQPVGSCNFQRKKAIEDGNPFRDFELRENCARKPTVRSQNWKKQQQLKQAAKGKSPEEPFCELQSDTASSVHNLDPDDSLEACTAKIIVSKKSPGKPTTRSQNWKKQQQLKRAAEAM